MSNKNRVKILPVDKTVVFNSPLEGDDDTLVRTGTIGEGSCFFHSVLYGCSKEYAAADRKGRAQFVKRLRASMAGKITRESWEELGGGLVAKIPYQEKVYDILLKFYEYIDNDGGGDARGRSTRRVIKKLIKNDVDMIELYKVITLIIPLDKGFNQTILKNAYDITSTLKIQDSKKAVISEIEKYLKTQPEFKIIDSEKAHYLHDIIVTLLNTVMNEADKSTFETYVKNLKSVETSIDSYSIGEISNRVGRDIYILDGKTRLPYMNASTKDNIRGRKSIILVWVQKRHYEVVGRLLPGNRIQREFHMDDTIVDKINTMHLEPDKISDKYPQLVPYLPREYQMSDDESSAGGDELNNSESDCDSDKYYDSSDQESQDDGSYVGSGTEDDQESDEDDQDVESRESEITDDSTKEES